MCMGTPVSENRREEKTQRATNDKKEVPTNQTGTRTSMPKPRKQRMSIRVKKIVSQHNYDPEALVQKVLELARVGPIPEVTEVKEERKPYYDPDQERKIHPRVYIREGEWKGLRGVYIGINVRIDEQKPLTQSADENVLAGVRLSHNDMFVDVPFKHLLFRYSWDWCVFPIC